MNWKLGFIGSVLLEIFGDSKLWHTKWFVFVIHTVSFFLCFFLIFLVLGLLANSKPTSQPLFLALLTLISIVYGARAHFIYKK